LDGETAKTRDGAGAIDRPPPEAGRESPAPAVRTRPPGRGAAREEIAAAIAANQVCVICGETGSGKTTQLPKVCLELGRGVAGMIGHTQPRRIAARTVAARIADELGAPLGPHPGPVGYKVRFGDKTSADTYIKVMTDGILLAETQGDRSLEQYDTIIIDEAHERSLNYRLSARVPAATSSQAARAQGHHHLRDDRPAAIRRSLRHRRQARADRGGVRSNLPRRDAVPAAALGRPRRPRARPGKGHPGCRG
jgi:hypothetical protein